jgi:cysteine desulfurase
MNRVYLDHNATTPVDPEVLDEMLPFLREDFGNASSVHWWGQRARRAVERARERVADLLGAETSEIVFTSGGTEAANQVLRGAVERPAKTGAGILTTAVEHKAVLATCVRLETNGVPIDYAPVDRDGVVDAAAFERALDKSPVLAAAILANNETGVLQPVERLAAAARARRVPFFTDAVQALGRIPVDVRTLGVDFLSLSGHKLHGPKGVGALYVRRGTRIAPLLTGGEQEGGRRSGTTNVPGVVGLGKACELAARDLAAHAARMKTLRDRLEAGLRERLPGLVVHGHPALRLPNTLLAGFPGVEGESLLMNLDLLGIAVSTGSACNAGSLRPSHVLTAMGRTPEEAHAAIRFSLGRGTTAEEIERTLDAVAVAVARLREASGSTAC